MKVGFLLLHPFSFEKTKSLATTVRAKELAISLSKMGDEVYIFTPYEESYETPEGIRVVKLDNLWDTLGLSHVIYDFSRKVYHTRAFQSLFVRWYVKRALRRPSKPFFDLIDAINHYEIDVLQAVQDNAALILLWARDKVDLPFVVDLHTIWPEEVVATGVMKRQSKEFKILQDFEEQMLQNMDLIVVLGEQMYEYILSHYQVEKKRVLIVEPGARPILSDPTEKFPPPKVVHSGIVSYRKNFKLFLDAIPYVTNSFGQTLFFATKKGDLIKWASSYVKKRHLKNFSWYWFPKFNQFCDFIKQCHVGIITNENSVANRMDMPSKLFDYLSLGIPVVTNHIGGWTEIVKDYRVGLTTSNSSRDFANGITTLLENSELAYECGKRGIRLIEERFNWDMSARKLHEGYLGLG